MLTGPIGAGMPFMTLCRQTGSRSSRDQFRYSAGIEGGPAERAVLHAAHRLPRSQLASRGQPHRPPGGAQLSEGCAA